MRRLRVRLVGGLGNQLFGYAAGYVMAEKSQRLLELDTAWTRHGVTDHGVDIRHFNLPGVWLEDRRLATMILRPGSRLGRLAASGASRLAHAGRLPGYVTEFPKDVTVLTGGLPRLFLRGYFQDHNLARSFLESLPGGLTLRRESPWLIHMSAIAEQEKPLGVHVRLGDYRTLPGGQALDFPFYENAISAALSHMGKRPVWIFTDDPENLGQLTRLPVHWRIVDTPSSSSAGEALILFSRLDGYVVANSTFSYWGATIGNKPSLTWRPDPWFSYGTPKSLVPRGWTPITATHAIDGIGHQ